jgi:hypothetical protein
VQQFAVLPAPATIWTDAGSAQPPKVNECFYEKVVKVKADVAALLNLFSTFFVLGTSVPPFLRFLVVSLFCSWWHSPHFHRRFGVKIAPERGLATWSTHSTPVLRVLA